MVIIILLDKLPAGAAVAKCSSYAVTAAAVLFGGIWWSIKHIHMAKDTVCLSYARYRNLYSSGDY